MTFKWKSIFNFELEIWFENYFFNYFLIFKTTYIKSVSIRDLSHSQLMKWVKNSRFQNRVAVTELNYHFKIRLNFQKSLLNEYSISTPKHAFKAKVLFQVPASILRGNFVLRIRFQNRVLMSKSTLNFVIEVGTSTWNLNSVLISILKIIMIIIIITITKIIIISTSQFSTSQSILK